ncbi:MAG: hypothetical protein LC798_15530 [Chloroflexi bacterium]|nr:hypothetical protein [Chloroflexota bacterium]
MAGEVYEQLRPLAALDERYGWPLAHYVAVLCAPIEAVAGWVTPEDDEPPYAVLLDLDLAPAEVLPWLGQFKGVHVTAGLSGPAMREQIATAEGFRRGMVPALVAATRRRLTGTKMVIVLERVDGAAYALHVVVKASEMPDPAGTLADAMSAKRIGIVLTMTTWEAPLINQGSRTIDASDGTIDTATYADIT